jgi:hypothetical protein
MLDTSRCDLYLTDVKAFATRTGQLEQLDKLLDWLANYGGTPTHCRVLLSKDFAPYSFGFVIYRRFEDGTEREWMSGGLIYHGAHDGHGSGAFPTLAVTLSPTDGWEIHT